MPQLNPSPWLMVFFLVWMFFVLVLISKTINTIYPNAPTTKEMKELFPSPWNWPW